MGSKAWGAPALIALAVSLSGAGDARADRALGHLTTFPGARGCIGAQEDCAYAVGGGGGFAAAVVSPDDRNLYVLAWGSRAKGFSGLLQFARAWDGSLLQLGHPYDCTTAGTSNCGTSGARGLDDPNSIAISPDGRHAYVSADGSRAVAAFARASSGDGALRQLAAPDDCVGYAQGTSGCGRTSSGLSNPRGIALSPDGRHVYVAGSGVAVLARNETTGGLTPLPSPAAGPGTGFSNSIVVSPDGKNVYTAAPGGAALVAYTRNAETGSIAQLPGSDGCLELAAGGCNPVAAEGPHRTQALAISPDGRHLYVASHEGRVVALSRDAATGAASILRPPDDCLTGQDQGCGRTGVRGLRFPTAVAISGDGLSAYVVSAPWGAGTAIVVLTRNPDTGGLEQLEPPYDCVAVYATAGCEASSYAPLGGVFALGLSADGDSAYAGTWPDSRAGAIVNMARDAPICHETSVTVADAGKVPVGLDCTDPGGAPPTLQVAAPPFAGRLGAIDQLARIVEYEPPASPRTTQDEFAISAWDGKFTSPPARVRITFAAAGTNPPAGEPAGGGDGDPAATAATPSEAGGAQQAERAAPPAAVHGPHLPTPAIIRAERPRVTMRRGRPVVRTGVVVECPRETERCFVGAALTRRVPSRGRVAMLVVGRGSVSVRSGARRSIVLRGRRGTDRAWRRRGCTRMLLQVNASAAGGNFWQRLLVMKLRHPAAGRARCRR